MDSLTPVWVLANDDHLWLLNGFSYMFNKYWNKNRLVGIFTHRLLENKLPDNFWFAQRTHNYPQNWWSNSLIELARYTDSDYFILMLEDYWITSPVEEAGITELTEYMSMFPEVLRMDLSADRASHSHSEISGYGDFRIIQSSPHSKYQMSFQAAIWNRKLLLEVLKPNESPWKAEIEGTMRLRKRPDIRVLGTLERPVVYQPVYRARQARRQTDKLPKEDLQFLQRKGWI